MSTLANKTIYMTYKKPVPAFVLDRWKALNPEYRIDFSLDADCIVFLKQYFGAYFANLFVQIPRGMFKADLWRLCKLYISGGVYADVDLVPYVSIDSLITDATFYSCMSIDKKSVFQAFMIVTKPRHPIILQCLISFIYNNPYTYANGPTFDMYNCLKYNIGILESETKYDLDTVKIVIPIGSSETPNKVVHLPYFDNKISYTLRLIQAPVSDRFRLKINGATLSVTRTDADAGWSHNHSCEILIQSKEAVLLFKETQDDGTHWSTSYVTHKGQKILDSRDLVYYQQGGW
jgi:hypothetical protein